MIWLVIVSLCCFRCYCIRISIAFFHCFVSFHFIFSFFHFTFSFIFPFFILPFQLFIFFISSFSIQQFALDRRFYIYNLRKTRASIQYREAMLFYNVMFGDGS